MCTIIFHTFSVIQGAMLSNRISPRLRLHSYPGRTLQSEQKILHWSAVVFHLPFQTQSGWLLLDKACKGATLQS